jgi:hypothetical protein
MSELATQRKLWDATTEITEAECMVEECSPEGRLAIFDNDGDGVVSVEDMVRRRSSSMSWFVPSSPHFSSFRFYTTTARSSSYVLGLLY